MRCSYKFNQWCRDFFIKKLQDTPYKVLFSTDKDKTYLCLTEAKVEFSQDRREVRITSEEVYFSEGYSKLYDGINIVRMANDAHDEMDVLLQTTLQPVGFNIIGPFDSSFLITSPVIIDYQ